MTVGTKSRYAKKILTDAIIIAIQAKGLKSSYKK